MKIFSKEEWIKLYEQGGIEAIKKATGISRPTISNKLKEAGIITKK